MKTLAWIASLAVLAATPSLALAQYTTAQYTTKATARSVLRSADHVEFTGSSMGSIAYPGGHCGCGTSMGCAKPVCYGYDNCCPPPPLLCCLKRVARMLDCLLPCNKCCPGGCLVDGCRPHFFGGRCCDVGCTTTIPSCSTPLGYPDLSDPFIDDPAPPRPVPEDATDVHRAPVRSSPYAARSASPYKVSTKVEVARQRAVEAAARQTPAASPQDRVADRSPLRSSPTEVPVLRRASAEDAPARTARPTQAAPSPPGLLPVIRRTSAEEDVSDVDVPVNPLRR
jgi:hypothetical protein